MRLRVSVRGIDVAPGIREAVARRVRLAIGRHVARVVTARVTLRLNGADAAEPKAQCRIHLRLREGASWVIEEGADDLLGATARTAWRLVHRLDRDKGMVAARASRVAQQD